MGGSPTVTLDRPRLAPDRHATFHYGVFVDGVEQVAGLDYSVSPGRIRFERAVVAQEGFTPLGHVMNALWMTVYPAGVEVTVELDRVGRVAVVTAQPVG